MPKEQGKQTVSRAKWMASAEPPDVADVGQVIYMPRRLHTEFVDVREFDELDRYQWYSSVALAIAAAWWPLCITVDKFKNELCYAGGVIVVLAMAFFMWRRCRLRSKMRQDRVACPAEQVISLIRAAAAGEQDLSGRRTAGRSADRKSAPKKA
jgi:hypothetical protein